MEFWYQFWPAFVANLIAGLVVLLVAYAFLRWYRHPALQVEAVLRGSGAEQFEFEVVLRNRGRLNFAANEIYWHIFVDEGIDVLVSTQEAEIDKQEVAGRVMKHFRGSVDGALFPDRPWSLLRLTVQVPISGAFKLHYFISTAYGQYPTFLRRMKDGEARLRNLPYFAEVTANGLVPAGR